MSPDKFTEWLMRTGLVPQEQVDSTSQRNKLKLVMYSNSKKSKFPGSGGYVWISESGSGSSESNKFIPVYKGSIFEATNHKPTVVLKLLYHWSCQTSISVISSLRKIRIFILGVKNYLTNQKYPSSINCP